MSDANLTMISHTRFCWHETTLIIARLSSRKLIRSSHRAVESSAQSSPTHGEVYYPAATSGCAGLDLLNSGRLLGAFTVKKSIEGAEATETFEKAMRMLFRALKLRNISPKSLTKEGLGCFLRTTPASAAGEELTPLR